MTTAIAQVMKSKKSLVRLGWGVAKADGLGVGVAVVAVFLKKNCEKSSFRGNALDTRTVWCWKVPSSHS